MFEPKQLRLFGVGLVLLAVGYICLGMGPVQNPVSMSVAPVILVGTYCVLFPLVILMGTRGANSQRSNAGVASAQSDATQKST